MAKRVSRSQKTKAEKSRHAISLVHIVLLAVLAMVMVYNQAQILELSDPSGAAVVGAQQDADQYYTVKAQPDGVYNVQSHEKTKICR